MAEINIFLESARQIGTEEKSGKLALAKLVCEVTDKGFSVSYISKLLNIHNSTLKDWINAYKMHVQLTQEESDKYSVYQLKKMMVDSRRVIPAPKVEKSIERKEKEVIVEKKVEKIAKGIYGRGDYNLLLGIYGNLKRGKYNKAFVRDVYNALGLILAEARRQMSGIKILDESEADETEVAPTELEEIMTTNFVSEGDAF